jgi:hypothetical protein
MGDYLFLIDRFGLKGVAAFVVYFALRWFGRKADELIRAYIAFLSRSGAAVEAISKEVEGNREAHESTHKKLDELRGEVRAYVRPKAPGA